MGYCFFIFCQLVLRVPKGTIIADKIIYNTKHVTICPSVNTTTFCKLLYQFHSLMLTSKYPTCVHPSHPPHTHSRSSWEIFVSVCFSIFQLGVKEIWLKAKFDESNSEITDIFGLSDQNIWQQLVDEMFWIHHILSKWRQ